MGCGAGHLLSRLQSASGIRGVGVDFSRAAIRLCTERGIPGVVASVYQLPFRSAAFTIVTCCELLEHLDFPAKAVAEMMRVLSANGLLIVSVPSTAEGEAEDTDEHVQQFSASSLRALVERWGEVVAIDRVRDFVIYPSGLRWPSDHLLAVVGKDVKDQENR